MQRERSLDADAKRLLADREGLARAVALALDHDALEDLRAPARSLDHLEVDAQAVAAWKSVPGAAGRARGSMTLLMAKRRRSGLHAGAPVNVGARMLAERGARSAAARASLLEAPAAMSAWCPDSRISGTRQPRNSAGRV